MCRISNPQSKNPIGTRCGRGREQSVEKKRPRNWNWTFGYVFRFSSDKVRAWYTSMLDALCISIRMQLVFDALCKNGANCKLHTLYTIHNVMTMQSTDERFGVLDKTTQNFQFERVTQNANAFWLFSLFCFECARFVFKFASIQLHFDLFEIDDKGRWRRNWFAQLPKYECTLYIQQSTLRRLNI